MKEFEEYKIVHYFMNPNEPLKGWINKNNFNDLFRKDWNCLMSVIEKIEQLNCNVGIFTGLDNNSHCSIVHFDKLGQSDKEISINEKIKIQAVYKVVVEFINWYNKNK